MKEGRRTCIYFLLLHNRSPQIRHLALVGRKSGRGVSKRPHKVESKVLAKAVVSSRALPSSFRSWQNSVSYILDSMLALIRGRAQHPEPTTPLAMWIPHLSASNGELPHASSL